MTYQIALIRSEPERRLYLAISSETYKAITKSDLIQDAIQKYSINLLIFDVAKEEIVEWIE